MAPSTGKQTVRISKASERTGLPESTIRYYDREFSEYLAIPRGKNNERLFQDKHLRDLEYIRYLIKREGLSVDEVRDRLREEQRFDPRGRPKQSSGTTNRRNQGSDEADASWERLHRKIDKIERRLDEIEQNQESLRELLDMNLDRYNQIIEALSL